MFCSVGLWVSIGIRTSEGDYCTCITSQAHTVCTGVKIGLGLQTSLNSEVSLKGEPQPGPEAMRKKVTRFRMPGLITVNCLE